MTEPKKGEPASKIEPPKDDPAKGKPSPGFEGEGQRSELGDGAPLPEQQRKEHAEHNRQVEESRQ